MPCTAENNFTPDLPKEVPDVIYLCFPNNPTGMVATKEQLKKWVDYANEHHSLILLTLLMRHLLLRRVFQSQFMKLKAQRPVLSNFVLFLRQPALRVCVADIR